MQKSIMIFIFMIVCLAAGAQTTKENFVEDDWDLATMLFSQGLIQSEQSAIELAGVLIAANYGKNFVVEQSLHAEFERQSLRNVWRVYGLLEQDAKQGSEEKKLLVVLDRQDASVVGIMNFTKKQNPYTPYLLKSRKKGQIENKNMAIAYATTILNYLDPTLIAERTFKARLKNGIWYLTGASTDKKNKSVTTIKMAQNNGEILAFELVNP